MRSLKTPWNVTLRFDDGDINVGLDEWKQSGCFSSALFSLGLLLHVTLTGLDYSAQNVARASDVKSGTETQSLSVNLAGQQSSRWEKHSEHDLIPASLSSPRVVNLLSSLPCSQVLLNSLPWIFSCFTDHLRGFLSTMDVLYLKSQPVVYTRAPLSFNMFLSFSSSPAAASFFSRTHIHVCTPIIETPWLTSSSTCLETPNEAPLSQSEWPWAFLEWLVDVYFGGFLVVGN